MKAHSADILKTIGMHFNLLKITDLHALPLQKTSMPNPYLSHSLCVHWKQQKEYKAFLCPTHSRWSPATGSSWRCDICAVGAIWFLQRKLWSALCEWYEAVWSAANPTPAKEEVSWHDSNPSLVTNLQKLSEFNLDDSVPSSCTNPHLLIRMPVYGKDRSVVGCELTLPPTSVSHVPDLQERREEKNTLPHPMRSQYLAH